MGKIRIKQVGEIKDKAVAEVQPDLAVQPKAKTKRGKPVHPRQKYGRSHRYQDLLKLKKSNAKDLNDLLTAVQLVQKTATARFTETIEAHINLVEPDLRVTVNLPSLTGRQRSLLILTSVPETLPEISQIRSLIEKLSETTTKIELAGPEKIAAIKRANAPPQVDEIWATPDIMKEIAKIARILGPAGLMPNPKKATIIAPEKLGEKLADLQTGATIIETERKTPLMHVVLGKSNMEPEQLTGNLQAIITAIKPQNIRKLTLCSTMGPAIHLKPTPGA